MLVLSELSADDLAMQKHLHKVYLALLAAAAPLSTDMYLPAMPHLAEEWEVPMWQVNLTLVLWFIFYSLTLLFWGSLSDRYGRRPILLVGLSLFCLSSILCAASQSVTQLIAARVFQGVAAAGGAAMALAITRDRFEGKDRQQVLAWIGIILGLAPMIAPSIGAVILEYGNWRIVFVCQAAMALLSLLATLAIYEETILSGHEGGVGELVRGFARLSRNHRYVLANGALGIMSAPLLGFIAFSPVAYIQQFGMNEQQFGLLFGANAFCIIVGSALCARMLQRFDDKLLLWGSLITCLIGGIGVLLFGAAHWLTFGIAMAIFSVAFGFSRPLVNHLILEQVDHDIGIASSAIVCYQFLCGAGGMAFATLDWSRPFLAFGVLAVVCPLISIGLWPMIMKNVKHGEEPAAATADTSS